MRCSFTCYVEAFSFCLPDKINGLLCRNMANMVWTSALTDKLNITCNRAPFAFTAYSGQGMPVGVVPVMNASTANKTVVFAVSSNNLVKFFCLFHCCKHNFFILNAFSVIRKRNDIRGKCVHIGKFPTVFTDCYCTVRINGNAGITTNDFKLPFKVFDAVRHRIKVRHGANRSIPSVCGGKRSRFDSFFI